MWFLIFNWFCKFLCIKFILWIILWGFFFVFDEKMLCVFLIWFNVFKMVVFFVVFVIIFLWVKFNLFIIFFNVIFLFCNLYFKVLVGFGFVFLLCDVMIFRNWNGWRDFFVNRIVIWKYLLLLFWDWVLIFYFLNCVN